MSSTEGYQNEAVIYSEFQTQSPYHFLSATLVGSLPERVTDVLGADSLFLQIRRCLRIDVLVEKKAPLAHFSRRPDRRLQDD